MENIHDAIDMPALGRPFTLGMLYDCRTEKMVTSWTFWDPRTLEKDLVIDESCSSEYSASVDHKIENICKRFDINGGIKLSFLSGMLNFSLGGGYQYKTSSNSDVLRATLTYKSRRGKKELSMKHLGNIEYKNITKSHDATHVVTMIEYGAMGSFSFELDTSTGKTKHEGKGGLNVNDSKGDPKGEKKHEGDDEKSEGETEHEEKGGVGEVVKGVIGLLKAEARKMSGKLDVKYKQKNENITNKIRCDVQADCLSDQVVFDYKQALAGIPKILQKLKKCEPRPLTVYLTPLCQLDLGLSPAAKLVQQIQSNIIDQVLDIHQSYQDTIAKIGAFLEKQKQHVTVQFVQDNAMALKDNTTRAVAAFNNKIQPVIIAIRSGKEEHEKIQDIVTDWQGSCTSPSVMKEIMNSIQKTSGIILKLIEKGTEHGVKFQMDLDEFIPTMATKNKKVAMLEFISLSMEPKKLAIASSSLTTTEILRDSKQTEWFDSKHRIYEQCDLFYSYRKWNAGTEFITTVASGSRNDSQILRTSVLEHGEKSFLELPSQPGKPTKVPDIEPGITSITIQWTKPKYGAEHVTGYVVSYHDDTNENKMVKVDDPNRLQTTVGDLRPFRGYHFEVHCQSEAGVSPPSQKSDTIWTAAESEDLAEELMKNISELERMRTAAETMCYSEAAKDICRKFTEKQNQVSAQIAEIEARMQTSDLPKLLSMLSTLISDEY